MNHQNQAVDGREEPLPPFYNLLLPIPSPQFYHDNYHHPLPGVLPPINCFADPTNRPLAFPAPMGILPADHFNLFGVKLHDFGYVNFNRDKFFVKYMLWWIEISDHLLRMICPSDLNDMPCEWDELQGGCPMLRLCEMRQKYPHPHVGQIPACTPEWLRQCRYIHGIEPSCRSIARRLREEEKEGVEGGYQLCATVGKGEICPFGHDLEAAREEAAWRYWVHRGEARERGSVGWVKVDNGGRRLLKAIRLVEEEE